MASMRSSNFIYSAVLRGRIGGARARARRGPVSNPIRLTSFIYYILLHARAYCGCRCLNQHYSVVSPARLESARWRTFFLFFPFFWRSAARVLRARARGKFGAMVVFQSPRRNFLFINDTEISFVQRCFADSGRRARGPARRSKAGDGGTKHRIQFSIKVIPRIRYNIALV